MLRLPLQPPEVDRIPFAAPRGGMLSLPGRASMTARFFVHRSPLKCVRDIAASKPEAMLRPATLDRVENGGSGSDINPREGKPKEPTRDKPSALPARDYPVCRRARDRQGRCAPLERWPEDGPSLTAAARVGVGNLRSGRKKACGAVEQKKGGQIKKARKQARNFLH